MGCCVTDSFRSVGRCVAVYPIPCAEECNKSEDNLAPSWDFRDKHCPMLENYILVYSECSLWN